MSLTDHWHRERVSKRLGNYKALVRNIQGVELSLMSSVHDEGQAPDKISLVSTTCLVQVLFFEINQFKDVF